MHQTMNTNNLAFVHIVVDVTKERITEISETVAASSMIKKEAGRRLKEEFPI